jgi:uncharacterized membrane-anchored protein YitT (DUF2179 family)
VKVKEEMQKQILNIVKLRPKMEKSYHHGHDMSLSIVTPRKKHKNFTKAMEEILRHSLMSITKNCLKIRGC